MRLLVFYIFSMLLFFVFFQGSLGSSFRGPYQFYPVPGLQPQTCLNLEVIQVRILAASLYLWWVKSSECMSVPSILLIMLLVFPPRLNLSTCSLRRVLLLLAPSLVLNLMWCRIKRKRRATHIRIAKNVLMVKKWKT